jgi:hypothetical protein
VREVNHRRFFLLGELGRKPLQNRRMCVVTLLSGQLEKLFQIVCNKNYDV